MDSLENFILKKKEEIKEIKGKKRWLRQSELEKQKEKEIEAFYEKEVKRKKIEEYERLKELSESLFSNKKKNSGKKDNENGETDVPLSNRQIIRGLRQLKEPIRLFGETDIQRYNRFKDLKLNKNELKKTEQNVFGDVLRGRIKDNPRDLIEEEEFKERTKKKNNLYIGKEKEEKVEKEKTEETGDILKKPGNVEKDEKTEEGKNEEKKCLKKEEMVEQNEKCESKENAIYKWIKSTMKEWSEEIEQINDNTKKIKQATYLQTHKDLKPLEKKLKKKTLEPDVLDKMFNVIDACKKRKFRAAHDAYMLLAIGNAAWPMGVTMVGIHERAGRSRIFTSEVAHILNDETTRKYIQMIKRLLSFCQRKYCNNPSEAVKISTIHI